MKKFLLLITLLVCGFSWGQATLPVTRTTWNSTPTGWTDSAAGAYTSSFACSTNNGSKFDTSGDNYIVNFDSAPDKLSFVVKSNSANSTSVLLVEESDSGSSYTTVISLTGASGLPTSCTTKGTYTLNSSTRYVRWASTKGTSNMTMDDVEITKGVSVSCSGTPAPGNTISSETSVVSGGTTNLSLQNATTGSGVTYQWQSSTTSASTGFTDISGATSATYTATVTAKTWYRCVVTCSENDGTSTAVVVNLPSTSVQFVSSTYSTSENTSAVNLVVSITNPSSTATTLNVVKTSGTTHIATTTFPVTFTANATANQLVSIPITNNVACGDTSNYIFELQNVAGGNNASVGTQSTTELTVNDDDAVSSTVFSEIFSSFGTFTPVSISGSKDWEIVSGKASINGYGSTGTAEDYLISSVVDMSSNSAATLAFNLTDQYSGPPLQIKYSTNFSGNYNSTDVNAATWTAVPNITISGSNNSSVSPSSFSADVSSITGSSVYFAFYYTAIGTGANQAAGWTVDDLSLNVTACSTPSPSIAVNQGAISIATSTGNYDFGNQLINSSSAPVSFTISNTGNADLTLGTIALSGTNANQFSVTQSVVTTVLEGNDTSFTVTFSPTTLGNKTATISIPNNAGTDYTFTVNGTGSNSASSDIIADGSYVYTDNIAYASYQATVVSTTLSESVGVFGFTIRDGSGTTDADAFSTELSAINFNYTGTANTVRAAALFDGSTKIADATIGTNSIVFSALSGASVTALDGGTKNLTLRVTFTTTVTDNEQLQFTIASATTNTSGSAFSNANAGGATSSSTGDRNRIEVVADRLAFTVQPANGSINTNLATFTIKTIDIHTNVDLDASKSIVLTTNGTGITSSSPYSLTSGTVDISDVQYNTAQTSINLTGTTTGLAFSNVATSNNFNISEVVYTNNDYRTVSGGTWSTQNTGTSTWEKWNGSSWVSSSKPSASTSNVYIRHNITSNGASVVASIIVQGPDNLELTPGGNYTISQTTTANTQVLIKSAGKMTAKAALTITGIFEIEDYGEFSLEYVANNNSSLWNGTEIFHPNSKFMIKEWDVNNSTSANRPLINGIKINTNLFNGYEAIFGNLIIDLSSSGEPSGSFILLSGSININLAHSNLELLNPEPTNNINLKGTGGLTTSGIGGDFIVDDGYAAAKKVIMSTSGALNFTVNGNMQIDGATINITTSTGVTAFTINVIGDLNITSGGVLDFIGTITSNPIINLNVRGNITIVGSGLLRGQSNGTNFNLNFDGTSLQTIDIASTSTSENNRLNFNIKNGAKVQLINRNFELGTNSKLTVEDGGTLDFGFDGITPLLVTKSGSQTGTAFESKQGSTLKITSSEGITTTGTSGNVQVVASNTVFSPLATFHYIGKADQVTGTGVGTSTNGRAVIVELDTDALILTPSTAFGITNDANTNINQNNGGILDIRKGRFIETVSEFVNGSSTVATSGKLKMADGTFYKVVKESGTGAAEYIPRLANLELAGGEIELGSTGNQTLRGAKTYHNLSFSNGAIKDVSTGTPDINELIYIDQNTTLDGKNFTIGKDVTDLLMNTNSLFKTGGSGSKPDAGGDYVLDASATIEFQGTSATIVRLGTPSIEYGNIIVNGTNVSNDATVKGILMQAGTTFTVKDGKTFKLKNTAGFSGVAAGAINMTNTPTITLEENSTIEYAGTTQTITEFIPGYQKLKISGTSGVKTVGAPLVKVNQDLDVTGSLLKIEADKTMLVTDGVSTVDTDATKGILIENNGSLVQVTEVDNASANNNSGFIKMARNSQAMLPSAYTYWSSPVDTQTPATFSPLTVVSNNNFLFWNQDQTPQGWNAAPQTTAMTAGKGYIIKTPPVSDIINGAVFYGVFTGKPNNGIVSIPTFGSTSVSAADYKWNLIGNPYPSAISASEFVTANSTITDGTLYFWTHNTPPAGIIGSYEKTDYASWNSSGGTGTAASTAGNTSVPTGFVASGQSFFVRGISEGASTATFNNGMRLDASGNSYSNNQFFRTNTTETATNTEVEKHRIWLNMNGQTSGFRQTLVGYVSEATNGLDHLYDGISFGGNTINFYSVLEGKNLVIQGRALPFDNEDTVPLGYRTTLTGNLTISIDHVDGLMEDQDIYLEDTVLNVEHDLKASNYTFATLPGTFNNRFVLRYLPQEVLSNPSFDEQVKAVRIYKNQNSLNVSSPYETIATVAVYDLTGRLLFEQKSCNTKRFETNQITANKQALIVKVTLMNGAVVTQKVL